MTATLTLEKIGSVKSEALKRVLLEQLQFRNESTGKDNHMNYSAHKDGTRHNRHKNCLCIVGGV